MSRSLTSAVLASSTTISPSRQGRLVPAERDEAKKRTDASGKSRSASSRRMTLPTWPVAPTTPTRMPLMGPVYEGRRSVDGLRVAEQRGLGVRSPLQQQQGRVVGE